MLAALASRSVGAVSKHFHLSDFPTTRVKLAKEEHGFIHEVVLPKDLYVFHLCARRSPSELGVKVSARRLTERPESAGNSHDDSRLSSAIAET